MTQQTIRPFVPEGIRSAWHRRFQSHTNASVVWLAALALLMLSGFWASSVSSAAAANVSAPRVARLAPTDAVTARGARPHSLVEGFSLQTPDNAGQLKWRYQTGDFVNSAPAVVNGVVYVGPEDSYVYGLKASDGTLLWRYQTGLSVGSSPKVDWAGVSPMIYVGSGDSYVYALTTR